MLNLHGWIFVENHTYNGHVLVHKFCGETSCRRAAPFCHIDVVLMLNFWRNFSHFSACFYDCEEKSNKHIITPSDFKTTKLPHEHTHISHTLTLITHNSACFTHIWYTLLCFLRNFFFFFWLCDFMWLFVFVSDFKILINLPF